MAEFKGTSGDDIYIGTGGGDIIDGFAGNDNLQGAGGQDIIDGGSGNDTIGGGDGSDFLSTHVGGTDRLDGGLGNDSFHLSENVWSGNTAPPGSVATVSGGDGKDWFFIQSFANHDTLIEVDAGSGDDELYLNGYPTIVATLGAGRDLVQLSEQPNTYDVRTLVITDFETGNNGDRLKWDDYLAAVFANYDRRSNPFATGHARLVEKGNDSVLQFDFDGPGGTVGFIDFFRLEDVDASDLTPFNIGGFPADGSAPADLAVTGTGGVDEIETFAGDDEIDAGDANDTVYSGPGDDNVDAGGGHDIVYTAAGNDVIQGGEGNDYITGGFGADKLTGGPGDDNLRGGEDDDRMTGGTGDDHYLVDGLGDQVIELAGEGTDSVHSWIDYVLPGTIEHLSLDGEAIEGIGNALANQLSGNGEANRLDGGGGADRMEGRLGDDLYIVDSSGDRVVEEQDGGGDTVRSSANHILSDHVEALILTGGGNINGTGNGLGNSIVGNNGNNRLDGRAGADVLGGGKGHDVYVVNSTADVVIEAPSSGSDTVESAVSFGLPAHFEKLILTGSFGYDGRGNAAANTISGNSGANLLSGGSGGDVIAGGGGDDRLIGGAGLDRLTGGGGDDRFYFNMAPGAAHADRILDFAPADDALYLLRSVFTKAGANGTLAASAFHPGSAATDAGDRILYDAATGNLFYDADGTGAAAPSLFATVDAGTPLSHADFIIYG